MHSLGPHWMDPQYLLTHFGAQFFWFSAADRLHRVRAAVPDPAGRLAAVRGRPVHLAPGRSTSTSPWPASCCRRAAFLGNVVGYEIGRAVGRTAVRAGRPVPQEEVLRPDHAFFEKHGNKALVIGRFVPVVRTFITVVAGVGRMDRRRFFTWSLVGAVLWATGITLLGYFLGHAFPVLQDNLELAVLAIVAVSLVPALVEYLRHRRRVHADGGRGRRRRQRTRKR